MVSQKPVYQSTVNELHFVKLYEKSFDKESLVYFSKTFSPSHCTIVKCET